MIVIFKLQFKVANLKPRLFFLQFSLFQVFEDVFEDVSLYFRMLKFQISKILIKFKVSSKFKDILKQNLKIRL